VALSTGYQIIEANEQINDRLAGKADVDFLGVKIFGSGRQFATLDQFLMPVSGVFQRAFLGFVVHMNNAHAIAAPLGPLKVVHE